MLDWNNVSSWKILIVEDEPDNMEVLSEMLTFYGAAVRGAEDGVQGLKLLDDYTPDLILLDLSMPQMDGWEMLRQIKANPKVGSIPVVALTAHAMIGDKERVLDAGFNGYVSKPISVATFLHDLRQTLESSHIPAAPTPVPPTPQTGTAAPNP
jgi:two-component system cell cycle response regulator